MQELDSENLVRIVYQDEYYVVVYKPVKMAVHRSFMSEDTEFLLQTVRDMVGKFVYPVHRLDRATSGLVVFALTSEANSALAEVFQDGGMTKHYMAVCRGWLDDSASITHALKRLDPKGKKIKDSEPQESRTDYRVLHRFELPYSTSSFPTSRYSVAEIKLYTGRRHQIRRHFAHISHHLIGDTVYGKGIHNRLFREKLGIDRLLLTAVNLEFDHPFTNARVRCSIEPDPEFQRLLKLPETVSVD